jgi:hypothetical protein
MSASKKTSQGGGREDRLAEALRANLRRRKAPRAHADADETVSDEPAGEADAEKPAEEAPSDDENSAPSSS